MNLKNIRNEEIEFVNCNLCGKDDTREYYLFEDYKYVQCNNCGLIYQNPRPVFRSLKTRYSKKYFEYEFRNHHNFFLLMKKTLNDIKFFKKIAPQFSSPRKFLDIGCATGLLLNYIREHNWIVKGVELCKESVEYARKNFKLDIFNGTFEQAKFDDESFHIIHFSHLIEHLPKPSFTLTNIYKKLKNGGYILVTTPRVDSFQQWLFKEKWRSFHRDHIYIFSKKTLIAIIEKAGFKVKKFISWGGIEKGKVSYLIKTPVDKLTKFFNIGDVMFVLAQKQ